MASAAGARRHFHRAVQQARFKAHALLVEVLLQQVRVRRGDAGVLQALRAGIFGVERGGQRQTAAAEIEAAQGEVARVFALSAAAEQLFFQHVFADDAQIDHAVHHRARNVVVAHAQDIDRHVFREGDQALLLQVDLDAAARQQLTDSSLRRPDFCIAIRKRVLSSMVTSV